MKDRGLNAADRKLARLMQQRTVTCLGHWKRRGYLKSSESGERAQAWEIVDWSVTEAAYDPLTVASNPTLTLTGSDHWGFVFEATKGLEGDIGVAAPLAGRPPNLKVDGALFSQLRPIPRSPGTG